MMPASSPNRRTFLGRALGSLAGLVLGTTALRGRGGADSSPMFTAFGVVARLNRAAELKALGAEYLIETVDGLLMPARPESDFVRQLELLEDSPLPVRGCNVFITGSGLKCIGPDANHEAVLERAEVVFRRAQQAGVHCIVFGSAGARHRPEGWPMDQADEQFIELLRRMAVQAEQHDRVVAVEPLQERECNYLTRLGEVLQVVRAVARPSIRAVADLYHMATMEEGPEIIAEAAPFLQCIEIAERDGRTAPGVNGQDFRPYFRALHGAGFSGPITIEGLWTPEQLRDGFEEIKRQAGTG